MQSRQNRTENNSDNTSTKDNNRCEKHWGIYTQWVIGKQDTHGNNQELINKKNYKGVQYMAQK